MIRILLIGVIPVAITLAIIFFLARPKVDNLKSGVPQSIGDKISSTLQGSEGKSAFPTDVNNENLTKSELLEILEASISAVNKRVDVLAGKQGVSVPQVVVPAVTTAPASSTSGPRVVHIPLGSGGSSASLNNYADISVTETIIDTANYPGYKNMYLEADMRIYQGNGTGFARLLNKTDGLVMLDSEVSTTSENFGLKTSGAFKITGGKKTYVVQLKSTTGYSVDLQTTRIRVEF